MATWPATLPNPLVAGYGLNPEQAFGRTEMQAGPARQRRRYTAAPTRVPVRWLFTLSQFGSFEEFYDVTIAAGADWFTVELINGSGLFSGEARFVRPFEAELASKTSFKVTAELEIRSRPLPA